MAVGVSDRPIDVLLDDAIVPLEAVREGLASIKQAISAPTTNSVDFLLIPSTFP